MEMLSVDASLVGVYTLPVSNKKTAGRFVVL